MKDQNELLKEDAVFFIADNAEEADDVVDALEGEITVFNIVKRFVNTRRYFIKKLIQNQLKSQDQQNHNKNEPGFQQKR